MSESWGYTPSEPANNSEQVAPTDSDIVDVESVTPEVATPVIPDVSEPSVSDYSGAPAADVPAFGAPSVAGFGSSAVASFDSAPTASPLPSVPTFGTDSIPVPALSFEAAPAPSFDATPAPSFDAAPAPYTPEPSLYRPMTESSGFSQGYTPAPTPLGGDLPAPAPYQPPTHSSWQPTPSPAPAPAPQPAQPYSWQAEPPTPEPQGYPVYSPGVPQAYPPVSQYPEPYAGTPGYVQNLVPGAVVQTAFGPVRVGTKSKVAAGLLGIFLGSLGVGRFYRGFTALGVVQLIVTIATCGMGAFWGLIEGIVVLVAQPGSESSKDAQGFLMTN